MLDVIKYSYAEILNTLWLLPDWLTASVLVIGGVLVALIANAVIVHAIRNTLGVRHPKTRSLLTSSTTLRRPFGVSKDSETPSNCARLVMRWPDPARPASGP